MRLEIECENIGQMEHALRTLAGFRRDVEHAQMQIQNEKQCAEAVAAAEQKVQQIQADWKNQMEAIRRKLYNRASDEFAKQCEMLTLEATVEAFLRRPKPPLPPAPWRYPRAGDQVRCCKEPREYVSNYEHCPIRIGDQFKIEETRLSNDEGHVKLCYEVLVVVEGKAANTHWYIPSVCFEPV